MSQLLQIKFLGPYSSLERKTAHNIPLTVWTFPEDLVFAKFAANFSPYMFDRFTEEFVVSLLYTS